MHSTFEALTATVFSHLVQKAVTRLFYMTVFAGGRLSSQRSARVRHGYGNTRGDRVTGTHGYRYGIGIWHTAAYRVPVPRCHGYFTGIL